MKIIQYKLLTGDGPEVTMTYSEENLLIAQAEAWNGDVEVVDDGQPEPEQTPTDSERIRELEEALELLLSGATE